MSNQENRLVKQLPTEMFSFEKLFEMHNKALKRTIVNDKVITKLDNASKLEIFKYIKSYFYYLSETEILFYDVSEKQFIKKRDIEMNKVYFDRFPKIKTENYIKNYFYYENIDIYKEQFLVGNPDIVIHTPTHKYINAFGKFKHDIIPTCQLPQEDSDVVDVFTNYIYESLTMHLNEEERQKQMKYNIKIFACICMGKQTKVIFDMFIPDNGTGKSTLFIIMQKLLGEQFCITCSAGDISTYNGILRNKLVVMLEELSNVSFSGFSEKLNSYATSDTLTYTEKYEASVIMDNHASFFAASNNTIPISHADGRRHWICPINNKNMGNGEYWTKLYSYIHNENKMKFLFNWLREQYVDENLQLVMPVTDIKEDLKVKLLPPVRKFIRSKVLGLQNINMKTRELYNDYCSFAEIYKLPKIQLQTFYNDLLQISILRKKSNGLEYFKYTVEELYNIAIKFGMLTGIDREDIKNKRIKNINDVYIDEIDCSNNDNTDDLEANVEPIQKIIAPKYEDMNSIELHELIEKLQQIEENKIRQQFNITEEKVKEQPKEPKVIVDFNNTNGIVIQELKKKNENEAEVKHISVF
jgi:hypothetical protein